MLYEHIGALEVTYGNALAGGGGFRRVTSADGGAAEVTAATYLWFKLVAPSAPEPARASSGRKSAPAARPQAVMALQIAGAKDRPRDREELSALQGSWVRLDKALDRQRGLFLWFFLATWQPPSRSAAPSSSSSLLVGEAIGCRGVGQRRQRVVIGRSGERRATTEGDPRRKRPERASRRLRGDRAAAHMGGHKLQRTGCVSLVRTMCWRVVILCADVVAFFPFRCSHSEQGDVVPVRPPPECRRDLWVTVVDHGAESRVWVDLRDLASNKWYVAQIVHLSATECRVQVHTWRKSREELVSLTTSRNRFARLGSQTLIYLSPAYPHCRKHGAQWAVAVKDIERARQDFDASFFDDSKQAMYVRQRLVPLVERLLLCAFNSNEVVEEVNAFLQHVIKGVVAWFLRQKVATKRSDKRDGEQSDRRSEEITQRLLSLIRMILSGMSTSVYFYLKYGGMSSSTRSQNLVYTSYLSSSDSLAAVPSRHPCRSTYYVDNVDVFLQAGGLRFILERCERRDISLLEISVFASILQNAKPSLTSLRRRRSSSSGRRKSGSPENDVVDFLRDFMNAAFSRLRRMGDEELKDDDGLVDHIVSSLDALYRDGAVFDGDSNSVELPASVEASTGDAVFAEAFEMVQLDLAKKCICCPFLSQRLQGLSRLGDLIVMSERRELLQKKSSFNLRRAGSGVKYCSDDGVIFHQFKSGYSHDKMASIEVPDRVAHRF
ncbi:hypothetical protein PINS_up012786 [Pythium insidiosum]|nr:hypothetical protein PINS_up012786 [Pythium insidiosum]